MLYGEYQYEKAVEYSNKEIEKLEQERKQMDQERKQVDQENRQLLQDFCQSKHVNDLQEYNYCMETGERHLKNHILDFEYLKSELEKMK